MVDDGQRERREQVTLDGTLEGPRAEVGREALSQKEVDGRLVPLHRPLTRAEAATAEHVVQLLAQDVAHRRERERAEDHHAVDAVDELASEGAANGALDCRRGELRLLVRKPDARARGERGAEVRGHDDDEWRKSAVAPRRSVRRPSRRPVEQIPHVRVRLLELVEEETERAACGWFDQRGGRPRRPSRRGCGRGFRASGTRHVEADHASASRREIRRGVLADLGLARSPGADEEEDARGTSGRSVPP